MHRKLSARKLSDSAVSPVIAVILMVAITVVLAAVVYVWVSGFSEQTNGPAGTLSLQGAREDATTYTRSLTVVGATPSLVWGDLRVTVNGETYDYVTAALEDGQWAAYRGSTQLTADDQVRAGDQLRIDAVASTSGQALRVSQTSANAMLVTLTLS